MSNAKTESNPQPWLGGSENFAALVGGICAAVFYGFIDHIEGSSVSVAAVVVMCFALIALAGACRRRGDIAPAEQLFRAMQRIPKATQFLIVAFAVTLFVSVDLQFDLIRSRHGAIYLLIPVAVAAVCFDFFAALFCALPLIVYYRRGFLASQAEFADADRFLVAGMPVFALLALGTAVFWTWQSRSIRGESHEAGDLGDLWEEMRGLSSRILSFIVRNRALVRSLAYGGLFALAYALFWSTFATLSGSRGLHTDSLEAYVWGREFSLGYYKHPPFWSWVAGAWFLVFPRTDFWFWFLSEINGALGLAGAFALVGRFAPRPYPLLVTLLLMLTPFYQFNAERFNANTILLSIWPWATYFFVRSIETLKIRHSLAFGVLVGIALLSKYFALILAATCFFAALTNDRRAAYFLSSAPYISVLTALVIIGPHVAWLFRDGFQPFLYASMRIDRADRAVSNLYLQFLFGNAAYFVVPGAILFAARMRGGATTIPRAVIARGTGISFLWILAFCPLVLTLLAGTVGHAALGIPFAIPIFALVPLCLVYLFWPQVDIATTYARRAVLLVAFACIFVTPFIGSVEMRLKPSAYSDPRDVIADEALAIWQAEIGMPLRYVTGNREYAMAAVFRSPSRVSEFNSFNFRWSPWVEPDSLRKNGLLIICSRDDLFCNENADSFSRGAAQRFERSLSHRVGSLEGPSKAVLIYVLPPRSD